ncbi:MAG: MerR family transcriptional regulator [Solobacterium sp.]|nr:MerR family transcriptional regulator [Solobacterium sp.]
MENSELCTVGMLCQKTGITRKTLFYYDRIGLLKPSARTGIQEHKLYDEAACERLSRILRFRRAGLRIEEIRKILDDPNSNVRQILNNAVARCRAQQNVLSDQICLLKELMEEYPS